MICRSCGTECRGTYCSHCGAPLASEAFSANPAPNSSVDTAKAQAPSSTATSQPSVSSVAIVPAKASKELKANDDTRNKRKKKHRELGPKIKMRQIFFPSLMLLLPLFYLFLDAFVCYADALYVQQGSANALSGFIAQLARAEFISNPVSDLIMANFGGDTVLFEILTVKDILSAADRYRTFVLPAVLLAVLSVLSALCGIATLFSRGKVLRLRALADTVIICGFLGALAPLLAGISFRLSCAASGGLAGADAAMCLFGYSIEVVLLCGLSLTLMLPAVRSLRRAAAGQGIYLTAPYRLLGKKIGVARLFGVMAALLSIFCFLLTLVVDIAPGGTLLAVLFDALEGVGANATDLLGAFGGDDITLYTRGLYGLVLLLLLPIAVISMLRAIFAVFRLLLARPSKIAAKKRRRQALMRTGKVLRGNATALLALYAVFYVLAVVLLLLTTGIKAHVDATVVSDTLTVLYLLIAQVKSCAPLYTAGVLCASLSILFGAVAGNLAKAFVVKSLAEHHQK
ncbi:MAG: hypothetical protein IKA06_02090 [Clostridia bacterium]|nr:hypothetical protein [Clostridia bacterium]